MCHRNKMHPIKRKHLYGYIYPLTPEIIPEIFNHGIFFYIKTGSEHHLQQCLSKINKVDPLIKFDFNYSKNQINVSDINNEKTTFGKTFKNAMYKKKIHQ